MSERPRTITKLLSENDTGQTGSHQAGILVPRDRRLLAFFPPLNPNEQNPRHRLHFTDAHGTKWEWMFIYYNNRSFGGTRNEYRLTRMTSFIRAHNLTAGDTLVFSRDELSRLVISYSRRNDSDESGVLKVGSLWRIVSF